jgi:hypothetical protein
MTKRPLTGAAKAAFERAKTSSARPKAQPRACGCGCSGMTKGGEFVAGHDARHKSNLIKEAKAGGNPGAVTELEQRGWIKFLEKSQQADAQRGEAVAKRERGERVTKVKTNGKTPEQEAVDTLEHFNRTKQACRYLQAINRYGVSSGERRVELSNKDVIDAILCNEHPAFTESDREIIALIIRAGH